MSEGLAIAIEAKGATIAAAAVMKAEQKNLEACIISIFLSERKGARSKCRF